MSEETEIPEDVQRRIAAAANRAWWRALNTTSGTEAERLDAARKAQDAATKAGVAAFVASRAATAALEQLVADPSRRVAFNAYPGLPPRIAILDPATHPLRPAAARMREHLNTHPGLCLSDRPIQAAELAKALGISEEDMRAIEAGEKTTDAAGWTEIQTALFLLGSHVPAEEIADPIGSGALDRALAREDDADVDGESARVDR